MTPPASDKLFPVTDRSVAILFISKELVIRKTTKEERVVTLYFDKEPADKLFELYSSGAKILIDFREIMAAEIIFNAAVRDRYKYA